jgi:hypothetical protein
MKADPEGGAEDFCLLQGYGDQGDNAITNYG